MRLVQCGVGSWGSNWLELVVPRVPGAEVVACVEPNPVARERAARISGAPAVIVADFEELPDDLGLEGALVLTDLVHHAATIRAALARGLDVLVEKPFAESVAVAEELVAEADRRGRLLMVSQNYRFHAGVSEVRDLVRSGRWGGLEEVAVDFRMLSEPAPDGTPRPHHSWPEPLLVDMAIHHFDLLRVLTGEEIVAIAAETWNPTWSWFKEPPCGVVRARLASGARVSYRGTWLSRCQPTPWDGEWRIELAEAAITWGTSPNGTPAVRVWRGRGGVSDQPVRSPEPAERAATLGAFVEAFGTREPGDLSGRQNLGTLRAVYGAVASAAAGGRWVDLAGEGD